MAKRRQPSKLIRIGDLLAAQEIVNKDPFDEEEKRYIVLNNENLSRVKIFGTVVSRREGETTKENSSGSKKYLLLELDDGTGTITVALFGMSNIFTKIKRGDIVDVIGKPRAYNNTISVTAQSIQVVDIDFELYQRVNLLEIESGEHGFESEGKIPKYISLNEYNEWRKSRENVSTEQVSKSDDHLVRDISTDITAQVLQIIKSSPDGISKDAILRILSYSSEEIDEAINTLRSEGEIMTPSSGKFVVI